MTSRQSLWLLPLVAELLWVVGVAGQELPGLGPDEPVYIVPRLEGPIVLDGRIDEPSWEIAEPLPTAMHLPHFGEVPTERTEFRVAHDGSHLYFSCRNFTTDPGTIQATSLRRDDRGQINDNCSIYLDTFNDEENAVAFNTTPAGIRSDLTLSNDAIDPPNFDWNSQWSVAVTQDGQGWSAEMRIPFSSLLFQVDEGRVTMGMSVRRIIAQTGEMITHPAMPSRFTRGWAKPSQMRKVVLVGVDRPDPLYVTPYSLVGGGFTRPPADDPSASSRTWERVGEVGLDLRYGLTPNLTLDLTINTDFAQVEADEQQVNLTRFSIFFPEKRRFFQERGAIFEYGMAGQERLFHSRRVGLANGRPVRIYGGMRVVGRVGDWDLGVLNMQTAESESLPSENQGVIRVRRRILNPNSYAGAILTTRLGGDGHRNAVLGFDGIIRVARQDFLTLNFAGSYDDRAIEVPDVESTGLGDVLARLNWQRRGDVGLSYNLDFSFVGDSFDPALGFLPRRNLSRTEVIVGHGWRPGPGARFLSYSTSVAILAYRLNGADLLETAEVRPTVSLETSGRHLWTFAAPVRYENLLERFSLPGGVDVQEGVHRFGSVRTTYRPPQGNLFQPQVALEAGQFYDGRQISVSLNPNWSPSMHISLGGTYSIDHVVFPKTGLGFTAHLARFRLEAMLSTATSAIGLLQYNSADGAIVGNFRFRHNPREGTDLFVVWNEAITAGRDDAPLPSQVRTTGRSLMVKYSRTLEFGF